MSLFRTLQVLTVQDVLDLRDRATRGDKSALEYYVAYSVAQTIWRKSSKLPKKPTAAEQEELFNALFNPVAIAMEKQ